eukprot:RCo035700
MTDSLETFVATAAGTRGGGVVHVIRQALRAPELFVFGELLEVPSVKELSTSPEYAEHKKWYDLLALFAYGTYGEYKAQAARLPELGPAELGKLKQLTVLTMAAESRIISYDVLLGCLELVDLRSLEDLLIDTITHGLITAKLDQRARTVEVLDTIGRDIRPDDIGKMLTALNGWVGDSDRVLDALREVEQLAALEFREKASRRAAHAERVQAQRVVVKKELAESEGKAGLAGHTYSLVQGLLDAEEDNLGDDMDEDLRHSGSAAAARKKRGIVGATRHGVR